MDLNADVWAAIFGSEQVSLIEDLQLRSVLATVLSYNYDSLSWTMLRTPYREGIRSTLPDAIQRAIRDECGDQSMSHNEILYSVLPETCDLEFPADEARQVVQTLRSRPELQEDLRFHRAEVSTFLMNLRGAKGNLQLLETELKAL